MDELCFMPHQKEAINKLESGKILCGGVGTGKSITALGYFYLKECNGLEWTDGQMRGPLRNPKPLYIITTARKRDTKEWDDECEKFGFGDIPIVIDSWNNIEKYSNVIGAFFIFDEQRVVGWGKWSKTFVKLAHKNHWILLTATPGDTWADYIPVFLANGFYKNKTEFLRRHAVYNRYSKYPKIDKWLETDRLEYLRRQIMVVMSYEKGTHQTWHDIFVNYDAVNYKIVAEDRWDPWKDEPIKDISGACYLMRKAANSGIMMVEFREGYVCEVDSRAAEVFRIWTQHKKVIVFYNYDYELNALKETLDIYKNETLISSIVGLEIAEWNGHVHEPLPDSDSWIYLVQYAAGAEGWNCTKTDCVVFYSQNYSYKTMTQAAGRIDRLNTPYEELHYYILKSKAGIDKAIERALKHKKNFNEKMFISSVGIM